MIAQNVGIGTTDPQARLHVADSNVVFTGFGFTQSNRFPPVSGPGTRMMWFAPRAAFRVGYASGTNWDRDSIGNYSFAVGYDTKAKGDRSFATGYLSQAIADFSTAMGSSIANGFSSMALGSSSTSNGQQSTAIGYFSVSNADYSTAIGNGNQAKGISSTALGTLTNSIGDNSISTGYRTAAKANASFVTGAYNDTSDTPIPNAFGNSDRIFQVGNGDFGNLSNAITILRNGNTGVGTTTPAGRLHVFNGSSGTTGPYLPMVVENNSSTYINLLCPATDEEGILFGKAGNPAHGGIIYNNAGNTDGFQFRTNGNVARMVITSAGNIGIGTIAPSEKLFVNGNVKASAYLTISDIRYKKNIEPLKYSLEKVLQLQAVSYDIKKEFQNTSDTNKQIGFIAQDIEEIIPEVVQTSNDGYKAIDYSRLTAVLAGAIKEQQIQIEELKLEVRELKKKLTR